VAPTRTSDLKFHKAQILCVACAESFIKGSRQLVGKIDGPEKFNGSCLPARLRSCRHQSPADPSFARPRINVQVNDVKNPRGIIRVVTEMIEQVADYFTALFGHQTGEGRVGSESIAEIGLGVD